jgi:carboxypeptidase PM20D1
MIIVYSILVIIAILILIIAIRTINFKTKPIRSSLERTKVVIDQDKMAKALSEAIKIKTISNTDESKTDWEAFRDYHRKMEELFPLVHSHLERETINEYSLLYKWKGQESEKKPIIMTAHMDVVPIEDGTTENWRYPPFSGAIEEGYVWGRGTLDTKITMIACLQAAELLLENGFTPNRDIYFAFGHDEETRSIKGATKIAQVLSERGLEFDFLMDEGGTVVDGVLEGVTKPLGLIGIAEKGFANIKITVKDDGGHSSMPPKHTAMGQVAQAIVNLENHQSKLKLTKPIEEFLLTIGPEMGLTNRIILANLWLFKPLFLKVFSKMKTGNALLRTTTAATMAQGSKEPNVLPESASATFNFRISPGETGEELLQHIKQVNKAIPIEVEAQLLEDPSMLSSYQTDGFDLIKGVTNLIYEDVLVSPYIVLAATDARKYENVCKNIYRFAPYRVSNEDLGKMHGTNENISIENIKNCVEFYITLFENC